ncbi:FliA/WhiG family RNA polymerase sigma factor [Rubrivivax gelatinosus]|uniref:RNA polymerase sigma factor for flagellar operon n=1 Tax=Rubrivivax gelatinosus (strain NBRC 100245 / IL144) TaxID=983917 RepID=I0HQM6_RUBGI|nr:FliA/WhiG family RNA polymerase sigma factor [Rubrivivax gelatinosus]BAL95313.1 RNA polymerase sigma factor for flagellar operon [Rubrivivax gelatinosus IL144]
MSALPQLRYDAYGEPPAAAAGALDEQRLLLAHAAIVKRVVRQLHAQVGGVMGREDMEQVGLMGLLEALRRYGPPDERFPAFAAARVRGAVLDELRRQDWRPRSVRQESHRVRDGVRELRRRLGREPSDGEVAAALGMTLQALQEAQRAENAEELASFDELVAEMAEIPSDQRSPEDAYVARRSLEQALRSLDEREQRVVQLYYEFDLGLREIAAVLGLTEARVCQINKGALRKMKVFLQAA